MFDKNNWTSPKPKEWYEFVVDGRIIGCCEGNTSTRKEIERLSHLKGIEIRPASNDTHLRFKTRTELPRRILEAMERKATEVRPDPYK